METLISAVQKLVIKEAVLYAEPKIAATREDNFRQKKTSRNCQSVGSRTASIVSIAKQFGV